MDFYWSFNFCSLIFCSLISLSQQISVLSLENIISRSYQRHKVETDAGVSQDYPHGQGKIRPHFRLVTSSAGETSFRPSSTNDLTFGVGNALLKRTGENLNISISESRDNGPAVRFRRSFGYYRSRCCYMDVMCSRGCRRPWNRSRQRRSLNTLNKPGTKLAARKTFRPLLDELQHTDLGLEVDGTSKERKQYINGNSRGKENPFFVGNRDDRRRSFVSRSKRSNSDPRLRKRNQNARHSISVKDYGTVAENTLSEIVDGLPQIIDSLEYLMKNQYPV